ncbi:MAG: DUF3560 domain-containing protein [Bdellovibrionaceae bacterium]|nr:DUF3560 domain-containing protein [Pseudobdellovibrionaceae bacterium]
MQSNQTTNERGQTMQQEAIENNAVQTTETPTLATFGVQVVETMTTPSRPGKKPRPVWVARGNVFGLEEFFRGIKGRKFRGAWSFFEDPSAAILDQLQNHGRQSYAEQVESKVERDLAKAERYQTYAANAEARAESRYNTARAIGSAIPLGQPILVGHHSERRHRRDIERIDQNMRKSVEESDKAAYLKGRAFDLSHSQERLENRRFVGNRISDIEKEIRQLSKWANETNPRLVQAREKLAFWQGQLTEIEAKRKEEGGNVASPETIKVGDLVYYIGSWMPVVRVNRKTVTVSHGLDIPHFHYKIAYTRIEKFQSKPSA